jgi:PAS domain S-box-containing protein
MNESLRLLAVKQFEVYNFKFDDELQKLVAIASNICDTPISLITLLDKDMQWIKVKKGTGIYSMPRATSFCTHVIQGDDIMIVPDTLQNERFVNNPQVVNAPHIRFYAGVPLITHAGHRLGALCVIGYKPHNLGKQQQLMLKMLSEHAINIMEFKLKSDLLDKSLSEIEEQKKVTQKMEVVLRSFFESSSSCHFLIGMHGEIIAYNKAANSLVKKVSNKDITVGGQVINYITSSFKTLFKNYYNLALKGEKIQVERLTDYGKHGKVWWEVLFEPAWNSRNEIIGVSYICRNINSRKAYEQKIIEQNRSLMTIAEVQSHDYRGPLTSIMGLINLIKEEDYHAPKEYIQMLEISVNKLDEKIQHVVDIVNS